MPKQLSVDETAIREVLGYLNFSSGGTDASFQRQINAIYAALGSDRPPGALRKLLCESLSRLHETDATAFADARQATAVISLVFDEVLPAYRRHHADLLFHLSDADFEQPFFLARVFEAVLQQGHAWDERERIVSAALDELNDFIGHRPLGVLNDGRQMEPYPHERFRPVPLYIRDAGVAAGKYHDIVKQVLLVLAETPAEMLREAYFDLSRLDELALDVRAHDHAHPANKRTNYLFGEWDPHQIDLKGQYRRYVVRQVIVDALLEWIRTNDSVSGDELLYDAAALLCGTMLMASTISGSGPDTHDSGVTLTSLLPKVAGLREAFYRHVLNSATGERRARLVREAEKTQQPFGHVRQHVNVYVAQYGSRQVQHRELAHLFARMGYAEASRRQAMAIPALSIRFESEIQWRLTAGRLELEGGHVRDAARLAVEVEQLLHRGIECGGILDPWNILAFHGNYPLFSSREDFVPDPRAESLVATMEQIFDLYSRVLSEASAEGDEELARDVSERFQRLADFWDRFATTVVSDIPNVNGRERWNSALAVSGALSEWKKAGQAAGDISLWNRHIDRFGTAKAFALVVETLLQKKDHVAAMGLLIAWLNNADQAGFGVGNHSIYPLFVQWTRLVASFPRDQRGNRDYWSSVRRMFDYLEANAGENWSVPSILEVTGRDVGGPAAEVAWQEGDSPDEAELGPDDDAEHDVFQAAYEGVVFRDSADDGVFGETMDFADASGTTEFEIVERSLEPRLRFLHTVSELWQMSAMEWMARSFAPASPDQPGSDVPTEETDTVLCEWLHRARVLQQDLARLMEETWNRPISDVPGDAESIAEYDIQLQTKFHVLHVIVATSVSCAAAERLLRCCVPRADGKSAASAEESALCALYCALFRGNATEARRLLPDYLKQISKKPLLYVPLERGGHPRHILRVRQRQAAIRFLLSQLPSLGLLPETSQVLKTARQMERVARPSGVPVTEFDRLFRVALRHSLEAVVQASRSWDAASFSDADLIEIIGDLVDRYDKQWQLHSRTMRISSVEALRKEPAWENVKQFVTDYGADLFHVKLLTLGNVRMALHNGTDHFLDVLSKNPDPLHPVRLVDDLACKQIDRGQAADMLELIYSAIIEKFERFLEYNTTTAQSDYGELLYCLLDMLRVESDYDRDAWRFVPIAEAHAVLARAGNTRAAKTWERLFAARAGSQADRHLKRLRTLEQNYGMRLPALADRLNERFVKPLAVDRMAALIEPSMHDARCGISPSSDFERLQAEIADYLATSTGSGIDVPHWLRRLEEEVEAVDQPAELGRDANRGAACVPTLPMTLDELRRLLEEWNTLDSPPSVKQPKRKNKG